MPRAAKTKVKHPRVDCWPSGLTQAFFQKKENRRREKSICHDCRFMPGSHRADQDHLDFLCDDCHFVRNCRCGLKLGQNAGGGWIRCATCAKWLAVRGALWQALLEVKSAKDAHALRGG